MKWTSGIPSSKTSVLSTRVNSLTKVLLLPPPADRFPVDVLNHHVNSFNICPLSYLNTPTSGHENPFTLSHPLLCSLHLKRRLLLDEYTERFLKPEVDYLSPPTTTESRVLTIPRYTNSSVARGVRVPSTSGTPVWQEGSGRRPPLELICRRRNRVTRETR